MEFNIGEKVLLKLNPQRRATVQGHINVKLAPQYFGPHEVVSRVGAVSYRPKFPRGCRVHPIFHISQLKPLKGDYVTEPTL